MDNMIHQHLIDLGFSAEFNDVWIDECGTPESGPMANFHPAYTEYLSDDERIIVQDGVVMDRQFRDIIVEIYASDFSGF